MNMPINSKWFTDKLVERQLSQRGLAKLMGLDASAVAIQCRTTGTPLELMDGWEMFFSSKHENPAVAVDQMALVATKQNGLRLCNVKRGYRRGTYNLLAMGFEPIQNVELAWASPILWIKTVAN